MPDNSENGLPTGHNGWDAFVVFMGTVKAILDDWRVMVTLLIVVLLLAGKVAGPELGGIVEGWIRAWKCTP